MCVIAIQRLSKTPMLKTLFTFQFIQSQQNIENFQTMYPKHRCKDTLKPEMQREWTHLLYKCKVKNTPCENRRPTTHPELNSDHVTNLRNILPPYLPPQLYFGSAVLDYIFAL